MTPFQLKPRVKNNSRTRKHIYEHIRVATPLRTGMHPYTNTHIHTVGSGRRRHQKGVMARGGPGLSLCTRSKGKTPQHLYTNEDIYRDGHNKTHSNTNTNASTQACTTPHTEIHAHTQKRKYIFSNTKKLAKTTTNDLIPFKRTYPKAGNYEIKGKQFKEEAVYTNLE